MDFVVDMSQSCWIGGGNCEQKTAKRIYTAAVKTKTVHVDFM